MTSASSFTVDSIDVLHPYRPYGIHSTATADGRYVFAIEYSEPDVIDDDGQSDDEFVHLAIFCNDLFLSRRTSFGLVGPLYSFGFNVAFYALDADSVVVVDYHEDDQLFRQRLISINWKTNTAECAFYRMYAVEFDRWMEWSTAVGEHIAVTVSENKNGNTRVRNPIPQSLHFTQPLTARVDERVCAPNWRPISGIVYPVNPLSSAAHTDISDLLERAANFVHLNYRRRQGMVARSTECCRYPFTITHQAVGLIISYQKTWQDGDNVEYVDNFVDLSTAIVLDLQNDTFYVTDVEGSVGVPLESRDIRWSQTNEREVTASYTNANFHSGLAVLNTRTMAWCAIQSHSGVGGIVPSRDGTHILTCQRAQAEASIRSICAEVEEQRKERIRMGRAPERKRFHLIRHPCKVPSLARLAAIAVQKSGGLPADWLPVADHLG